MSMRDEMVATVRALQDHICSAMEAEDGSAFVEDRWERPGGGGGRSRVLQEGLVFEKAGVNTSVVHGELSDAAAAALKGQHGVQSDSRRFFATGVSLVLHPHNPMAPTVHANYRYFELGQEGAPDAWWFGGGADLTPSYLFEDDAQHFHQVHADVCDRFDPTWYPRFKAWCDRYFYLPHRGESRGVGGIFFDHMNDRDPALHRSFADACGRGLVRAYRPILARRKHASFTPEQKQWQQLRRGRYVEFNLVWDRGTQFGLRTDARTESVLMSLPLTARWQYNHQPAPGSDEQAMVDVLRTPRDWLGRSEGAG